MSREIQTYGSQETPWRSKHLTPARGPLAKPGPNSPQLPERGRANLRLSVSGVGEDAGAAQGDVPEADHDLARQRTYGFSKGARVFDTRWSV